MVACWLSLATGDARHRVPSLGAAVRAPSCVTFPLTGTKKGATCDAKLCDNHASSQGRNRDFCPTHAAMKPDFMDRLKARWAGCTACGLATSRTHIVLGTGP